MADKNELIDVCTDLIRLVEGVGCKDWRDQNGRRFKDTIEWARAYVAINNAREESREQATPPADAALADVLRLIDEQFGHAADVGATYIAFTQEETKRIAAALRARAVPDEWIAAAESIVLSKYIKHQHPKKWAEFNRLLAASKEEKT